MPAQAEPPGCRHAAVATGALVVTAVVLMIIGLALVNDAGCAGNCEMLGSTLLFAGLPVSAVFGVLFGDLVLAWPLDMTFWVVLGFVLARRGETRKRTVLRPVVISIGLALAYGLVLSQFVEIAI